MKKIVPKSPVVQENDVFSAYGKEIVGIIRSNLAPLAMKAQLKDFHEKDIAEAMEFLTPAERKKLYRIADSEMLANILEYADQQPGIQYLNEIDLGKITSILELMDTDNAVALLRELPKDKRNFIMDALPDAARDNILRNASYDEEEIGSLMTSNYILLQKDFTIKEAMNALIEQAEKNDNISTLFVSDADRVFVGAIDLKNLITARQNTPLEALIMTSFPYVYGQEEVEDCLQTLKEYSESSVPVLDHTNRIVGVITAQNLLEATDTAMGEDYAMLAGLTAEEDLKEPIRTSIRKRLPWLMILLGLGLVVSSVVGSFEAVVSQLTIIMAFQSLILDMAGNAGTQSLAVTIRVLTSEGLSFRQKVGLISKEVRIGLLNGLVLGNLSLIFVGLFIFIFKHETLAFSFLVSACIGVSLLASMLAASAVGTAIPMFFERIGIDPAVASGPLITTINDLVAVVCYYGLSWVFLINIFHLGN